ncbi:MAG: hypothetical protein PHW18_02505 [Sulfuricurvum sp.]|uniref:hypothetical protein n=1 Tax=Sulfuricurvum sp. TaxID=2025608 RepID=UPI002618DE35|nr:hypothetical protein [Sulfuricurvum sp.]MDD2828427.1 hypothetical protein [Sulfuricurvum sp.]MDD4949432.1 hypothetical protein [Sulfuricurvum sp.]
MKKFLFLIPISLVAASSAFWLNTESSHTNISQPVASQEKSAVELFTQSDHALKQIIRHGDENSIAVLSSTLKELEKGLKQYEQQGFSVTKADELIAQYKQDSLAVSSLIPAYLQKLQTSDAYEQQNEKKFKASLDQIGLYELKATFEKLEQARVKYIKSPSQMTQDEYAQLSSSMKNIIRELYLDSMIEKPLYTYIDNHERYFQTIATVYNKVGVEKIERLTLNEYAIKGELQLLPKL